MFELAATCFLWMFLVFVLPAMLIASGNTILGFIVIGLLIFAFFGFFTGLFIGPSRNSAMKSQWRALFGLDKSHDRDVEEGLKQVKPGFREKAYALKVDAKQTKHERIDDHKNEIQTSGAPGEEIGSSVMAWGFVAIRSFLINLLFALLFPFTRMSLVFGYFFSRAGSSARPISHLVNPNIYKTNQKLPRFSVTNDAIVHATSKRFFAMFAGIAVFSALFFVAGLVIIKLLGA